MPTTTLYRYTYYEPPARFWPGTQKTKAWGPWEWGGKGVVVTAEPFDASTDYRALSVTEVESHTSPAEPAADKWLYATIRNVGRDPIGIWYVTLTVIAP